MKAQKTAWGFNMFLKPCSKLYSYWQLNFIINIVYFFFPNGLLILLLLCLTGLINFNNALQNIIITSRAINFLTKFIPLTNAVREKKNFWSIQFFQVIWHECLDVCGISLLWKKYVITTYFKTLSSASTTVQFHLQTMRITCHK